MNTPFLVNEKLLLQKGWANSWDLRLMCLYWDIIKRYYYAVFLVSFIEHKYIVYVRGTTLDKLILLNFFIIRLHNATDYTKLFAVDLLRFCLHCKMFEEGFCLCTPVTTIKDNIVDLTLIHHTQHVIAKKVNIMGAIQGIKGIHTSKWQMEKKWNQKCLWKKELKRKNLYGLKPIDSSKWK